MDNINSVLPLELLDTIFQALPLADLKNVLLVCKLWKYLGESPWLWATTILKVSTENLHEILQAMTSRRWMSLRSIAVRDISDELLSAIIKHLSLRKLELNYVDLVETDEELLANAVVGREVADIRSCSLTSSQAITIFEKISRGSPLHSLLIGPTKLSAINPAVLGLAVTRLELVEMRGCQLTKNQIISILQQAASTTRLSYLDIRGNWATREVTRNFIEDAKRNIKELLYD